MNPLFETDSKLPLLRQMFCGLRAADIKLDANECENNVSKYYIFG